MRDALDTVPNGTLRSSKAGRIKPIRNQAVENLRIKSQKIQQENQELKERLAILEEAVAGLTPTKRGKKSG